MPIPHAAHMRLFSITAIVEAEDERTSRPSRQQFSGPFALIRATPNTDVLAVG
jgi:hypothetical protein